MPPPLPVAALALLLTALYGPVLRDLFGVWLADPNYSHGLLIAPIAAAVAWSRRHALSGLQPESRPAGAAVLVLGLSLLTLGAVVEAVGSGRGGLFVRGVSLVPVTWGLVLLLLGAGFFERLAFPLAYLVFMVPLPEGLFAMIALPLQLHASNVTTAALQTLGIPAFREGNLIHLPSLVLGVAEACSGIRSLVTLLAGGVALTWLIHDRWWQRAVLLASVIPIAIAMNAVRITGTGILAHLAGGEAARDFFHDFSSWLIVALACLLLWAEAALLQKLAAGGGEAARP